MTRFILEDVKGSICLLFPITGYPHWVLMTRASPHTARQEGPAFPRRWGRKMPDLIKLEERDTEGDAVLSPLLCVTARALTSHQKAGLCQAVLTVEILTVPLPPWASSLPTKDLVLMRCKLESHELAAGPSSEVSLIHVNNTFWVSSTHLAPSLGLGSAVSKTGKQLPFQTLTRELGKCSSQSVLLVRAHCPFCRNSVSYVLNIATVKEYRIQQCPNPGNDTKS